MITRNPAVIEKRLNFKTTIVYNSTRPIQKQFFFFKSRVYNMQIKLDDLSQLFGTTRKLAVLAKQKLRIIQ